MAASKALWFFLNALFFCSWYVSFLHAWVEYHEMWLACWSIFQGQLGSVSSPESQQQTGNSQIYGTSRHSESVNAGSQGTFSPYRSGSAPLGFYALQRESVFPERPGQPECQFYMKTGDCKFGAVCRFHHPRERLIPAPDCVLSPIGLPLRPVSSFFIIPFFLPSNYPHLVYVKCFYQNLSLGGGKTELQNLRSHT